jgi:hypothetical protein
LPLFYETYAKTLATCLHTEEENFQVDLDQWLDMKHFFEIANSTHTLFALHATPSMNCGGVSEVHVPCWPVFFVNNSKFDSQMYETAYR